MDKLYDFSGDRLLNRPFGGSGRKVPVEHGGIAYMLKYTEHPVRRGDLSDAALNRITAEYIGSHISASMGLETQQTFLGFRNGEPVVACRDFRKPGESNMAFGEYVRGFLAERDTGRALRLDQVYGTIRAASNIPEELKQPSIDRFWDLFVVDALVGNPDRNKENWGFVSGPDDSLRLAPAYGFGSALLPDLTEDGIKGITGDLFQMAKRCLVFPSPALLIGTDAARPGYYDLLSSGFDGNCTRALLRMVPKINMDEISRIIDETPFLSGARRTFDKQYLALRKALVIDRAYKRCADGDFDQDALERIQTGHPYTDDMLAEDLRSGKLFVKSSLHACHEDRPDTSTRTPDTLDSLSDAELDARLQHSYEQALRGEGRPLAEVFARLENGLESSGTEHPLTEKDV